MRDGYASDVSSRVWQKLKDRLQRHVSSISRWIRFSVGVFGLAWMTRAAIQVKVTEADWMA